MKQVRPRALVVEDEAAARALLAQLLESLDLDVDLSADGEDALARLNDQEYDVILLDIMLPKVSGLEVMEGLQRERRHLIERIIVVTGLNIEEIRTLFPAVHDTIAKPVLPRRLREAVRTCLAAQH